MCARNPFFDPARARGPRSGPDVGQFRAPGASPAAPLSVSALVASIKDALADAFPQSVAVIGEISNLKIHSSGHIYFRLKDARSAIDAVMFRDDAARLKFTPEDGLEVIAEGRVDVYELRGQLQLYVERLSPKGTGALELAFRQLREKLQREGLFDPAAKRPLPTFPRAVGVVTSPTGAAIRDIRRTLLRRWPAARVYLVPSLVQGEGAAKTIAEGVALLDANAERYEIDTIIVARGGGSLEDLWPFNEENVARAIFAARTAIISGVGHEVDVTIADLVADARAATPTAAAELAVPHAGEIARRLAALGERLRITVSKELQSAKSALDAMLRSAVFRDPTWRLRREVQHVDELSHRLVGGLRERIGLGRRRLEPMSTKLAAVHPARLAERAAGMLHRLSDRMRWALGGRTKRANDKLMCVHGRLMAAHPGHRLKLARQQLAAAHRQIAAMSYRKVLRRGFTVTRSGGGILRSARQVRLGENIETEFHDGKVASRVEDDRKLEPPRPQGPDADRARSSPRKHKKAKPGAAEPTLFDP
ncbi:MAG: exodeoxyribonuclease VII large subunit [Planctomycetota bacterium]|jgi:exodeoxyribonuclease VII large subunit